VSKEFSTAKADAMAEHLASEALIRGEADFGNEVAAVAAIYTLMVAAKKVAKAHSCEATYVDGLFMAASAIVARQP
jgi:hypothetical protein